MVNWVNFKSVSEFIDFLEEFNSISGESLKFTKSVSNVNNMRNSPKLNWVNVGGLLLLQRRFDGGSPFPQLPPPSNNTDKLDLFKLLEPPKVGMKSLYSHDVIFERNFGIQPGLLEALIRRPTARSVLSKQRSRLKTKKIPFYTVCNDLNHTHILATVGLNKKEYSQFGNNDTSYDKQNISESIVHQRVNNCKGIISEEVYKCSFEKIHFLPIINNHTDLNLGDCSYLDTCHKMKTCRYLHYYTLNPVPSKSKSVESEEQVKEVCEYTIGDCFSESFREILPPQWINCDIRYLPFSILGKFAAIISDPAWDIHMSLPYGTCKDDELLSLPMSELQEEGIIMLWVTGRSIEIGRRALLKWGYRISDEMIWVKLNQLKRTIVTGRTGHWLNHSKEHLLVGLKGNPIWLNRKIDTDVVVSGTRETSRKPDEFYDIVERLVGVHSRKLEIFGRDHNTRPGWLTIGNQLQGVSLHEPEVKRNYELYLQTTTNNKKQ
ncbi:N6-adenosine-methyltransferase IME4 [Spathaspora sp. JA1]|nr:N6-adenosine-methyltransferase IME4 [Spathaspora sp. JA1]